MARPRSRHVRMAEPDETQADRFHAGGPGTSGGPDGAAEGELLLTVSPFGGDLAEDLEFAGPRRSTLPGPTLFLGAAVLVVAGFIGGAQAQRLWGESADTASTARLPGGAQGASGTSPGGVQRGGSTGVGAGFGGRGATAGTVQKVSGKVIYLRTASGETVKVTTTGSTKVLLSTAGEIGDLKAGATVVVQGSSGSGGVTATTVSQSSGLPGGAPGGTPGGSPGGPPS